MKSIITTVLALALVGCARFSTTQYDTTQNQDGSIRQIRTKAHATAFFQSSQGLKGWTAEQTDSSQSASITDINQAAESTNLNSLIGTVVKSAIDAAK